MTLSPEAPLNHSDESHVSPDFPRALHDMSRDELRTEAMRRADIPFEEIAAAIEYEKIRDAWDSEVEKEVDKGGDRRAVEYQKGPPPKGLTLYELIEKNDNNRRREEHRIQVLNEQIVTILERTHDDQERQRLINELFARDRLAQEKLHQDDATPYQYKRPEVFDELG